MIKFKRYDIRFFYGEAQVKVLLKYFCIFCRAADQNDCFTVSRIYFCLRITNFFGAELFIYEHIHREHVDRKAIYAWRIAISNLFRIK